MHSSARSVYHAGRGGPGIAVSTVPQVGVIPFRNETGSLSVLLIRRKPDGPWGIPKGHIEPGLTPKQAARAEALEEAGIEGEIMRGRVGTYRYEKFGVVFRVRVWLMQVLRVHDSYLEIEWRERRWFPFAEAVEVAKPGLKPLIVSVSPRIDGGPPRW